MVRALEEVGEGIRVLDIQLVWTSQRASNAMTNSRVLAPVAWAIEEETISASRA
jgi:hypothetical protein